MLHRIASSTRATLSGHQEVSSTTLPMGPRKHAFRINLGAYTCRYWREQNSYESHSEPRSTAGYNINSIKMVASEKGGNNEKYELSIFESAVKMHQFLRAFAAVSAFFF